MQLQSDLEQAKEMVQETTAKMMKERQEVEVALKEESHHNITKIRVDYETQISTLEINLAKMDEEKANAIVAIEDESAKIISSLDQKVAELQKQVVELEAQKQSEIESLRTESGKERDGIVSEVERKYERVVSEQKQLKEAIEEEHNKSVLSLKLEMETKEKRAIEQIKANEIELEKKMNQLQLEAKQHLEKKVGTGDKERQELMNSIEALKDEHTKLEKHIVELESKYVDATEEIDEWQKTFDARSYCNLTYVQEDATAMVTKLSETASKAAEPHLARAAKLGKEASSVAIKAAKLSKEASSAAIKAAEPHLARASKLSREASSAAIKAAEPHLARAAKLSKEASNAARIAAIKAAEPHIAAGVAAGNDLYNQHLKESVDKHILPLNEMYFQPALNETNTQLSRGKSLALQGRSDMVQRFKFICRDMKGELRQRDVSPQMMKMINDRCNEPEQLVDAYLCLILVIFIYIFRKSLRRIILFPFWIVWYLTPLRFIYCSTSSKITSSKITSSKRTSSKPTSSKPTSSKPGKVKSGKKKGKK